MGPKESDPATMHLTAVVLDRQSAGLRRLGDTPIGRQFLLAQ